MRFEQRPNHLSSAFNHCLAFLISFILESPEQLCLYVTSPYPLIPVTSRIQASQTS
jgi:hypothetical protein